MTDCLDDVSGSRLAFRANEGGSFADTSQGLTEITAAANERDFVVVFVDVILFVSGGENFAFINKIHAQRFENLRFGEMPRCGISPSRGS